VTESKNTSERTSVTKVDSDPPSADTPAVSSAGDDRATGVRELQNKPQARAVPPARTARSREPEDQIVSKYLADTLDRSLDAAIARLTFGIAPVASAMDVLDWMGHLAVSPGKQARLFEKAVRKAGRFWWYAARSLGDPEAPLAVEPLPQDRRFSYEGWRHWPFNWMHQSFLLTQQWCHNATTGVRGVSPHDEAAITFAVRQLLDVFSPSNFPLTNPEVLDRISKEGGQNLVRGWHNLVEDLERQINGAPPAGTERFEVGGNLAVTPGKVVFRNQLMELIQYSPSTDSVWREPVLMLSAWMMKYYIMDLSPHNSMVKYLVDQGHTVFMISWKNPGPEDRDLSMEDYRTLGIMDALKAISAIVPGQKVHAVGYCLGGILLTIAAATMGRDGDERLASITLFTTLTDFTEVGEIGVFIDPAEVASLEDMMWEKGYLEPKQALGGFQLLRSNDLIWSRMVREYLLGDQPPMFDLMAWNADGTRMPFRQHSELLHGLFLNNDLAEGRYQAGGRPIALDDIHCPIFAVAASRDHVALWRSVYKLHLQSQAAELTFVLTSGGHNVGIVNEPGHPGHSYRMRTSHAGERTLDPDTWLARTPQEEGSWWPAWTQWLAERSSEQAPPPSIGASEQGYPPLEDAPGTYVFEK
jgi:polyhydroxyalkanoate synthase subunit PhaC